MTAESVERSQVEMILTVTYLYDLSYSPLEMELATIPFIFMQSYADGGDDVGWKSLEPPNDAKHLGIRIRTYAGIL